ncbi:Charged multivesicular body protein 6 [Candida viswanathii]|uniref:Charged multivesicular body protein 6 n=1 Tax=Candida viswanathii TaxID=5486 RepID=A0A367XM14_9ASCO|nr:Charged multivesicular body protein 6 [Candida viswanathii]
MGQQSSAPPKITAEDKAIFQLKKQRDKLKQYQKRINTLIDKQTALARKAIVNNHPERAKFYLRSKKQQESLINTTFDQLNNLEKLIGTIEFKLIEKDVVYGLQQGNEVLQKLNNEMKVEKIESIIDQLEDEKLKVDEVTELLGSVGQQLNRIEEGEVDDELKNLEEEIHGKKEPAKPVMDADKLPDAPKTEIMPDAPSNEILTPQKESKEQNEPIAI